MAMTRKAKIITIATSVIVAALAIFIFFRFFFVYSSGVNTGELNYFQREGIVFKTYEGKLIQSGFKATGESNGTLRSNELKFSVTNKAVADTIMRCSGKRIEVKWNRYMATLPWRGNSQFVVTEVLSVE